MVAAKAKTCLLLLASFSAALATSAFLAPTPRQAIKASLTHSGGSQRIILSSSSRLYSIEIDDEDEEFIAASSIKNIAAAAATTSAQQLTEQEEFTIEGYSRCLSPTEAKKSILDESRQYSIIDRRPKWQRALRKPVKLLTKPISKVINKSKVLRNKPTKPGSLILLRCGESKWTKTGRFTGWADPDIIQPGILEMEHAARLLLSEGYEPDIIYTSRLTRAVKSTWTVLNELNAPYLPVYKSWRLNERNYGALTGLKKMDAAKELGVEVVQAWRNSLKARPPPMKRDDPYYPGNDRRYEDLTEDQIPLTESLNDCMERARPLVSREFGDYNICIVFCCLQLLSLTTLPSLPPSLLHSLLSPMTIVVGVWYCQRDRKRKYCSCCGTY